MAANRIYHPLVIELAKSGAAHDRAVAKIRAALEANDGRIPETAKALDCGRSTLARWLARKDVALQTYAAKLRTESGIPGPRKGVRKTARA